ncbi:MAG: putative lactoylglutathione lyase [Marmoricola sp.]|nr:putative lactoylglutathione lyase [Marmoricola sp.]
MTMIFLNLPSTDVAKGSAFFSALGWERNAQFSDENTASHVIDENIVVMLLDHEKFTSFLKGDTLAPRSAGISAIYCLSRDSRDAVDELISKAVAAGGQLLEEPQDHGFMYGQSFADPDGHVFEIMWMDPAVIASGEVPEVASA